ncbi:uncharacterized protein METZ01_LOCUS17930 [marine metagenome]|uniref:Uncharacterized protein n=1 Tax=marine metagenome TaxID=408172 RepID=A0A381PDK0_9ZZZZ
MPNIRWVEIEGVIRPPWGLILCRDDHVSPAFS